MPNDLILSSLPAAETTASRPAASARSRPSAGEADTVVAARQVPASADSGLEAAPRRAASALFPDRDVEVTSYFDSEAGRTVYRVADPMSGEVLLQSPADELLRFYASSRAALDKPLLAIDV